MLASKELPTPEIVISPLWVEPCAGSVMLTWLRVSRMGPLASGSDVETPYTWSTGLPSKRNCTGARSWAAPWSV